MVSSKAYLASQQKFHVFIGTQLTFSEIAEVKAVIQISYNNKYSESIEIDISQYGWILVYSSPVEDIAQYIKKIKEHQERQGKHLINALNQNTRSMIEALNLIGDNHIEENKDRED
jgi:hypothetical protein